MTTPKEKISKARKFAWEVALYVTVGVIMSVIGAAWWWIPAVYGTVTSIGINSEGIAANKTAISEVTETLGGMGVLFGNAEILEEGQTHTASVNTNSDARRWSAPGTRLQVINTGDRRKMSTVVTVEGKFEDDPSIFLFLSRSSGSAIGAAPGDKVQVSIEEAQESAN